MFSIFFSWPLVLYGFAIFTPYLLHTSRLKVPYATSWHYTLMLSATFAFFMWWWCLRVRNTIQNTPTSKVSSAAQGFVELVGKVVLLDDEKPMLSPYRKKPCAWFFATKEVLEGSRSHVIGWLDDWKTVETKQSLSLFFIDDGTGLCCVEPSVWMDIKVEGQDRWIEGEHRYTEIRLEPKDNIYLLGDFYSANPTSIEEALKHQRRINDNIRGQPFYGRGLFEKEGNDFLSLRRWKKALAKVYQYTLPNTPFRLHFLRQPRSGTIGQLFMACGYDPEPLAHIYGRWSLIHLLCLFTFITTWAWQKFP